MNDPDSSDDDWGDEDLSGPNGMQWKTAGSSRDGSANARARSASRRADSASVRATPVAATQDQQVIELSD